MRALFNHQILLFSLLCSLGLNIMLLSPLGPDLSLRGAPSSGRDGVVFPNGSFFLPPCKGLKTIAQKEEIHKNALTKRHEYWTYLQKRMSVGKLKPYSPNDPGMAAAYIHWSVEPTWTCQVMQRFGLLADGGKEMCDAQRLLGGDSRQDRPLVYSFGSKLECDFEKDLKARFPNAEIHTFDPTPGVVEGFASSPCKEYVEFHGLGLGGDTKSLFLPGINNHLGRTVQLANLLDVQNTLGHGNRVLDVLKVDIEGSEFDAFSHLARHAKAQNWPGAKLIMLEVHLQTEQFRRKWKKALSTFRTLFSDFDNLGYRVYYKELNPYDARHCAEYALINERYVA